MIERDHGRGISSFPLFPRLRVSCIVVAGERHGTTRGGADRRSERLSHEMVVLFSFFLVVGDFSKILSYFCLSLLSLLFFAVFFYYYYSHYD